MLTEVDYNETSCDTSYREYKTGKEAFVVKHHLLNQQPSELGVLCDDEVVTRAMKVEPWWNSFDEVNTHERFPHKYIKLNVKVQGKVSSIQAFQKDNTRKAMYTVYKTFMEYENEKDYSSCDDLLRSLDVSTLDLRVIMSLLMASNPIKAHLSYRQEFYALVAERSYMFESFDQVRSLFERLK